MFRLEGKVALVTGAASGIGRAIAELFAKEGARVLLSDINDKLGQSVADSIGENAKYMRLDVSQESDWLNVSDFVLDEYGRLDILVNNAGITGFLETEGSQDPENFILTSWREVHATNMDGVALGCKYAIGLMKNTGGASIVNISSRSGIVGVPEAAAYASSKASIRNHTKTVALYCTNKSYPIRCNSIHPAAIYTPMWDAMLGEESQRKEAIKAVEAGIPLGSMGKPIDVAYAALFLASDESKYVTGIELNVDGGILAGSSSAPRRE